MPILPSDVDGVEPGPLAVEDDGSRRRVRELSEVLLTARAKMLGISQSFAHRMSELPERLKSPLVSALGEIVSILEEHQIRPGETRLTGKVRLGTDVGMDGHFPRQGDLVALVEEDDEPRGGASFSGPAARGLGFERKGAVGSPSLSHRRRRAESVARKRAAEDEREGRLLPPPREASVSAQAGAKTAVTAREPDARRQPYDVTYGYLWTQFQARRALLTRTEPLTERQHRALCWLCLQGLFGAPRERPEGFEEDVQELLDVGYAAREERRWKATARGFEASGLLGLGSLSQKDFGF